MADDYEQFYREKQRRLESMADDPALTSSAGAFLTDSLRVQYSYNFEWLGLPIFQYPQDLVALQEIIWRTRPQLIIETGIARGGSLLFYASMLELLGSDGLVVGIDVDFRAHNRRRLEEHPLVGRIRVVDGSSTSAATLDRVRGMMQGRERVMVVLDSNHTHEHVLAELEAYTPFVRPGGYCVVFDTIIELMPGGTYSDRPWDRGDNPATAVASFLEANRDWRVDEAIDNKLLVSAAPGGYLLRVS